MSTIYILVGPPGSGKSTYVRENMGEQDVRVSMDDIQQMMGGGVYTNYRKKLMSVYEHCEKECIRKALSTGRMDVWIDRTCMVKSRRAKYIRLIRSQKTIMPHRIIVIDFTNLVPFETLLERRMQDARGHTKGKWSMIIRTMLKQYQEPELSEGIDEIRVPQLV